MSFTPVLGNRAPENVVLLDVATHETTARPRWAIIEQVAASVLSRLGDPQPPMSALSLADALGFEVKTGFPGIPAADSAPFRYRLRHDRDLIEVPSCASGRELHELVATALGEWLLWRAGLQPSGDDAVNLAAALMLPGAQAASYLAPTVAALAAVHIHCTDALIRRRREACSVLFWATWGPGGSS